MDGFVDRLHALRFVRECDPSYGALTFTLVGLPPTGYISLLLDILFGSFLPSLWSSSNHSLLGSREPTLLCNQVLRSVVGVAIGSIVTKLRFCVMEKSLMLSIRPATVSDVPLLLRFSREFAEYERQAD